jgi:Ca2+-binding RTX toxin-like protein
LSNLAGSLRDIPYDTGLDPVSGIVTPQAFRGTVNEALKAWLEYQGPFNPLSEAERQRQKLTCGDTRPTAEARKTNGGGVYYTTNDVFPGGPWGGVLKGIEENDSLLAGEYGEDEVYGLGANDHLESGACDDKLYGGSGRDRMEGEDGDDVVYAGPGNDSLGMSSTAGMATTNSTLAMGSGMSSTAVKARIRTLLTNSTMWTGVARKRARRIHSCPDIKYSCVGPQSDPFSGSSGYLL